MEVSLRELREMTPRERRRTLDRLVREASPSRISPAKKALRNMLKRMNEQARRTVEAVATFRERTWRRR